MEANDPNTRLEVLKTIYKLEQEQNPNWFSIKALSYLSATGSNSYGTNGDDSDFDVVGFAVPYPEVLFRNLDGEISEFDKPKKYPGQWENSHIKTDFGELDFTIYNIAKYFRLCAGGNPNMLDSLFSPDDCLLVTTPVWELVKQNRQLFLSQRCWKTFRGMLYSHLSRLQSGYCKVSRLENVKKYGYDVKDAAHAVRMILEMKEILTFGTLTIDSNSVFLKDILDGLLTKNEVEEFISHHLGRLDDFLSTNPSSIAVPVEPDVKKVKDVLVACLEIGYGQELVDFGFRGWR